jgi:hypothetical protein
MGRKELLMAGGKIIAARWGEFEELFFIVIY